MGDAFDQPVRVHVVATAGHVDHGKSALVRALTGTDPDRWAEEKRRGLTIDLGFASTRLASGDTIAFVDVPGHVRFLKNMVAGVGAVEACLFVVDCTEGWRAQSEEHLRILEQFGVRLGIVVLTKIDLVDDEQRARVDASVAAHVAGTFLEPATRLGVDAVSGRGLDELRAELELLAKAAPPPADSGRPRLWIDRAFSVVGAGTVVTGTLTMGSLHEGDELVVVPAHRRVRVRGLQVLHERRPSAPAGCRVALNLTGADAAPLGRGEAVVKPGQWFESDTVDATLDVLAALGHPVARRGSYLAYVGTAELAVELRVLGDDPIRPGTGGLVRLRLPTAIPLLPGDRYLLRETGRQETIGGGEVLDVAPVLPASQARPDRSPDRLLRERGWIDADEFERLTGERREPVVGRWLVDEPVLDATRQRLLGRVEDAGNLGLALAQLDERERAVVTGLPGVVLDGDRVRRTGDASPAKGPLLDVLRANPLAPPLPGDDRSTREQLRVLLQQGSVFHEHGIYFAAEAAERAADAVARLLEYRPDGVSVGEIRDALGTSRKYAIALLARLDATGRTRRRGELRIAGPRLRSGT